MKLFIAALAIAAVSACPPNWAHPCVITSTNDDLRPIVDTTCPASEYIGEAGREVNPGTYTNVYRDWSGYTNVGTGSAGSIYAQQCSTICVNHPQCTAFTWQVTGGATGGCRWGNTNDCWGNVPTSSGSTMGGSWMVGQCKLYKSCSPNDYIYYNPSNGAGVKLWHLGAGDGGKCSRPGNKDLDVSRKPKECPSGEELTDDGCRPCPAGTFKFGISAAKCQKCRTCPDGEYQKETCPADADTTCFTHSEVCSNEEYQTVAPTKTSDRACATCGVCAAGSMISYGCNRPDPWYNQKWSSDESGNSKGAVSVFQNQKVDGKPVVIHDNNMQKAGCGVLKPITACPKEDPWMGQAWASDATGKANVAAVPSCVSSAIKHHVILIHDSNKNKVGCGKLYEVAPGKFEAAIAPLSSYGGFRALRGLFQLAQEGTQVTGTATLEGLESSETGVWHVHEGTSCASPHGHLLNPQLGFKAEITKFPGYAGQSDITGDFYFRQVGTQLVGKYELGGLPTSSMGMVHLHDGTSCESPGGHLMNDQSAAHVHKLNRRLIEAAHPAKAEKQSTGDTQCTPCLPGAGFTNKDNSPACLPLTPCATGTYETEAGTSTTDRVCSACTNAPANAVYTSAGSTESNCLFECAEGYTLTNAGTECSLNTAIPKLRFKSEGNQNGSRLAVYDNQVLTFENFKCIDEPNFCGDTQLHTLQAELDLVKRKVDGLQRWGKCITEKKDIGLCDF